MSNATCSVHGCDLPVRGLGWCRSHHARYLKHGTPGTTPIHQTSKNHDGLCMVDGCTGHSIARQLCAKHHSRLLRHGDAEYEPPVQPMPACSARGCKQTARYRAPSLCGRHYQRLRGTGSTELIVRSRALNCAVDSCDSKPNHNFTLCDRHHTERLRYGTAGAIFICECGKAMGRSNVRCTDCAYLIRLRRAKDAGQRRRAALAGRRREPIDSLLIYQRDEWRCGLCLETVDRLLSWPNPRSASLDHIKSLSNGGTHTRDNVQCAHLGCNVAKGNRDAA